MRAMEYESIVDALTDYIDELDEPASMVYDLTYRDALRKSRAPTIQQRHAVAKRKATEAKSRYIHKHTAEFLATRFGWIDRYATNVEHPEYDEYYQWALDNEIVPATRERFERVIHRLH